MEVSAMLKSDGFNLWANAYDKSVNLSEEANECPFAGYKMYQVPSIKSSKKVMGIKYQIQALAQGYYLKNYMMMAVIFMALISLKK